TFSKLLSGQESVADLALNALNDVAIGVNGTVTVGYDKKSFTLEFPVGNATLMYIPGVVAFRGEQPNLFAGTKLESLIPASLQNAASPPRYFVDGSIACAR